jgi:transposase
MAALRNRKFFSLKELNEAINELLEKLNNRKMQKINKSRKEMFEELDKLAALPLPAKRYEYAEWKKCRVNIDYHIEADKHYYSVPYQLLREQVDVRLTDKVVEVYFRSKRQASHVRCFDNYKHSTLKEHMPLSHQKHLEWNPTRIMSWAESNGPYTKELIKNILETRRFPEQGYRSCLGIFRLAKIYTAQRVENACRRAVSYRNYSFKSVKNILENNLDTHSNVDTTGQSLPVHENVRGVDYYNENQTSSQNSEKLLN